MDEVNFCSYQDCLAINNLSAVLKGSSGTRLTLSARCVQILYEGFRQAQVMSCTSLSHTEDERMFFSSLEYLQKVVENTRELTIFENGETLQGHVSCTDFLSVTSLEVKCLPLYQLYGLSKVAHNLTTVTCVGCITRAQDLFEMCGADTIRASEVHWTKLAEVHLSYNNLYSLDNSLRLVSNLRHLDLSRNNLSSTDNFLMVLDNLETLNLSNNSLRIFPAISKAARKRLTSLNLRNNLLTSLEGLEQMFCLRSLDISNNLLSITKALNSLRALLLLQCLVLAGNPLGFHPKYRQNVIGCLHPAAVPQICFDGHPLTRKKKKVPTATLR